MDLTSVSYLSTLSGKVPFLNIFDGFRTPENVDKEDFLWNEYHEEKIQKRVNIQGHNILNLSAKPTTLVLKKSCSS